MSDPVISAVEPPTLASIELGGTKTIVAIGTAPDALDLFDQFPTADPAATLGRIIDRLDRHATRSGPINGIGIAAFGPLRVDPDAADWGTILSTPKPGWSNTPVAPTLARALGCPVAIDTDVNAAALAEQAWGAGRGCDDLAYITVGTGIGGGLVIGGAARHGHLHPEMGHIRIRRHPDDDFAGCCPFHGDCLEGLASGPALSARLGAPLDTLPADHPFRAILSDYLAQLCLSILLIASVQRIILGGGAVRNLNLLPSIERQMQAQLGGYAPAFGTLPPVVAPDFADSGLAGGFLMAGRAVKTSAPGTSPA